ncbi:MAG: class I mannose-6-phosphate isomerase [Pirellulales bacterium]|nr:class I mannose-6-phosphate isomerase [Pirellulales bacterium]
MNDLCNHPLRFEPVFRRYLWGGRRLATMLGKRLGAGDDYAESWELVDHGSDQTVVQSGPAKGLTLRQLVADHGADLLGKDAAQTQFPLLFKFLDCNRTLSVQVHPNDDQARKLDPPDLGKTEAWVVLAADPGSKIYAGLKPGIDRAALRNALAEGTCETCLHEFQPRVGDCVFIEAGTVHALGAGLVIAEIQQASDTTFRLFDWNRVDGRGQARPLHIEESLGVTNFSRGPVSAQQPIPTAIAGRESLVACDKFVLDRCSGTGPHTIGGEGRFHLLVVLEGSGDLSGMALAVGHTCLLPAKAGAAVFKPHGKAVVLDIYLPEV